MFTGFPEETTQFFLDIRFHNSVSYYNENKERFVRDVQTPFYAFIEDMAPFMQRIDPLMEIRPYKCLSRLRRDTRFTRDKSPYRDHLWLCFRRAAEPRDGSVNYWFEYGPGRLSWGLGFWGENKPVMERFRREMAADPARVMGLIDSCDLPGKRLLVSGSTYKRMALPDNVPERMRPWYTGREIYIGQARTDLQWASSREVWQHALADYQALAPVYKLLRGMQDEANEELALQETQAAPVEVRADEW